MLELDVFTSSYRSDISLRRYEGGLPQDFITKTVDMSGEGVRARTECQKKYQKIMKKN
jgi:hypothetical protein